MTELKYGGKDVKIMYGSQEIGGGHKSGDVVFSAAVDNLEWGGDYQIFQYTAPYKPSKGDEYTIHALSISDSNASKLENIDATFDNISSKSFVFSSFKFAINSNGELSWSDIGTNGFFVTVVLK